MSIKNEKTLIVRLVRFNRWLIDTIHVGFKFYYPRFHISFIKNYFKNKKVVGMEVGTYEGVNAKNLLKTINLKKLYLVDPYAKYDDYKEDGSYLYTDTAESKARRRVDKYGEVVCWVKEYSKEASKGFKDNSLDFIYIDANHFYKYIKEDMHVWWRKVKVGGVFSGHDINVDDVLFAVSEFVNEKKIKMQDFHTNGEDWVIVKR